MLRSMVVATIDLKMSAVRAPPLWQKSLYSSTHRRKWPQKRLLYMLKKDYLHIIHVLQLPTPWNADRKALHVRYSSIVRASSCPRIFFQFFFPTSSTMLSNNLSVIIVIISFCSACDSTTSSNDTISKIFVSPFRQLLTMFKLSSNGGNAFEEYITCKLSFHLRKIVTNSSDVDQRDVCIQKRSTFPMIELPSTIEWFIDTIERKIRVLFDPRPQSSTLSDEGYFRIEGRRRYQRLFPILVGAYMILSTVLIPIGVTFMVLLVSTSILLSKLSAMMSLKSIYNKPASPSAYNFHPYYQYHSYHGPPWRIDENRKVSQILENLYGSTTKEEETDFQESSDVQ